MSILVSHPRFFAAQPACGRRILAGFSYLQRIGKGARTRLWFPEKLLKEKVEWAAVRQFELLQEAGNLAIDELEVADIKKSFLAWGKMRAGGYRLVVLTLGDYADAPAQDDLQILDQKIQEEITRMIHFLYLSEQSGQESAARAAELGKGKWSVAQNLPHVGAALGATKLFKPKNACLAEETFFEILGRLPSQHIMHDVAVGLALPDATKEKNWIYLAKGEHQAAAFFGALGASMGEMIGTQMRGYGDRLTPQSERFHRALALAA